MTAHTASEGCALAAGCNCKSHSFCCRWRCLTVSKQESQSCVRTVTWTYGREGGKKKKYQLPIEPWEYNKGHARSVNALLSQCWVSPTKDIQVPVSSRVNIGRPLLNCFLCSRPPFMLRHNTRKAETTAEGCRHSRLPLALSYPASSIHSQKESLKKNQKFLLQNCAVCFSSPVLKMLHVGLPGVF